MGLVKNDCRSKWDWSHFLQEHVGCGQECLQAGMVECFEKQVEVV